MKVVAIALLLVAGACALPGQRTVIKSQGDLQRSVDAVILDLIEYISNRIVELGLDPLEIDSWSGSYELTDLLEVQASVTDVSASGLSNIVVNEASYNLLTAKLIIDLSLPRLESSVGSSEASARLLSTTVTAAASGSLAVTDLRLRVEAVVALGTSGVTVDDVDIDLSLGGIESDLNVNINGEDLSDEINEFLEVILPELLADNADEINELLKYIIKTVLENLTVGF